MYQQKILLIVIGILITGIAVIVGVNIFSDPVDNDINYSNDKTIEQIKSPEHDKYDSVLDKINFYYKPGTSISSEELLDLRVTSETHGIWVEIYYREQDGYDINEIYKIKGGEGQNYQIQIGWEYRLTLKNNQVVSIERIR